MAIEKPYFRFIDAARKITGDARSLIWRNPGLMPKDCRLPLSFVKQGGKLDAVHSYDSDFTKLNGKLPVNWSIEEPVPMAPTLGLKVAKESREEGTKDVGWIVPRQIRTLPARALLGSGRIWHCARGIRGIFPVTLRAEPDD